MVTIFQSLTTFGRNGKPFVAFGKDDLPWDLLHIGIMEIDISTVLHNL